MRRTILVSLTAALISVSGISHADGHATTEQLQAAVKARQAHMQLFAFNLGKLGAMAKGEVDYDATGAQTAADDLAALATMSQSGYWLPGSDADSIEGSRSLAAIWVDGSDIGEKAGAFTKASMAMQAAAGGGLESLQGAMGDLGASCGGCHRSYRQRN